MGLMKVVGKIRSILTKVTDLLLIGRDRGWWNKKY